MVGLEGRWSGRRGRGISAAEFELGGYTRLGEGRIRIRILFDAPIKVGSLAGLSW